LPAAATLPRRPPAAGSPSNAGTRWGHRSLRSSCPHDEVGRQALELALILAAPGDHLAQPLLPADLRLPADIASDRRGAEPVARVLMLAVAADLAELIERDPERLRGELDHPPDRYRLRRAGVVDRPQRRFLRHQMDGAGEITGVNVGLLGTAAAMQRQ